MTAKQFPKGTIVLLNTNEGIIRVESLRYSNTAKYGFRFHFLFEGQEHTVGRKVASTARKEG